MSDGYSTEQLGRVVRRRRYAQRPAMTQEQLGEAAGYGAGAGVSISRVEKGLTKPGRDKLAGIADALATTVAQLERDAVAEDLTAPPPEPSVDPSGASASEPPTVKESTRAWAKRLEVEIARRVELVNTLGAELETSHGTAQTGFYTPFIDTVSKIANRPFDPPLDTSDDDGPLSADKQAEVKIKTASSLVAGLTGAVGGGAAGAAAGGAAAYATFVAATTFGSASTGAAISSLSGVAATNATLAALGGGSLATGGAGVAGGTALLASMAAAPVALLGIGGLVWMLRRNRKQEAELRVKLAQLEAELASTEAGFEATLEVMRTSTGIFNVIATYAGRAVRKWTRRIDELPSLEWAAIEKDERGNVDSFTIIAACYVTITNIDLTLFMNSSHDELLPLIESTRALLDRCATDVDRLV